MQRHFDDELKDLTQELLHMGSLCEKMIQFSLKALLERNMAHASEIMAYEDQVNHLHVDIDDHCMRLLALQTPVASDLRAIIAALKINNDLERIGDQACNISQNTMDYLKSSSGRMREELPRMAELSAAMVREALDAYVRRDPRLAEAVMAKEELVDALKDQIFNAELGEMSGNASLVRHGLDTILIARNLEKVGDHATNIAEDVIFMVKAKDIRHRFGGPEGA